ncbi:hypothetical protein B0H66DRAFT_125215 [Apodospora peruviana]|uniref:Pal1-like protein n=1 Tax=Apodospora peruviana TaxID=516989 RepID=A0AAE0MBZ8_9PEZI|nr:hypothetical protein B0H66DRAFT_125215 [Apodospora peruviana]
MALPSNLSRTASAIHKRTMYLRVNPVPASMSERRAVFRALQQHGEIQVFKKLHDASRFISVAATESTFRDIIDRSPLQFDYDDGRGPASALASDPRLGSPSRAKPATTTTGETTGSPPAANNARTFTIEAFPDPYYPHEKSIRMSPLHSKWPPSPYKSMTSSALLQAVPKDMAASGTWDWETGGQMEDNDVRIASMTENHNATRLRLLRKRTSSPLTEGVNQRRRRRPGQP